MTDKRGKKNAGAMLLGAEKLASSPSIAVTSYNSGDVHDHARHDAWASRGWPSIAALFDSQAIGEFYTESHQVTFDGLMLQYASGTARDIDRSVKKARKDGIDILGVGFQFDTELRGRAGDKAFFAPARSLLFLDMAQASSLRIPKSRSMQLGIPRDVAEEHFGPVRKLHGLVAAAEQAAMLVNHLLFIRQALPNLTEEHEPRLARTVIDMLAIVLENGAIMPRRVPSSDAEPAAAARRTIDARLGLASLTVPSLCASLRISRSALYRMFETEGGVEAYIRNQRLEKVRQALNDPANDERIGELAYRWGFSDASHMSRQFRDAFGMTPSAFRASNRVPNG